MTIYMDNDGVVKMGKGSETSNPLVDIVGKDNRCTRNGYKIEKEGSTTILEVLYGTRRAGLRIEKVWFQMKRRPHEFSYLEGG
ncbi:Uncharacterized protein TCM_002646 [Theobroma cacao]|uniref:Uncharacterized protein n=1 Tax=Theobroma cacao TaxID=3641 RepID=A0A061DLR6_THECC|nr:Uncharacterized protein TCM_002646 [Theobroma cacao]